MNFGLQESIVWHDSAVMKSLRQVRSIPCDCVTIFVSGACCKSGSVYIIRGSHFSSASHFNGYSSCL